MEGIGALNHEGKGLVNAKNATNPSQNQKTNHSQNTAQTVLKGCAESALPQPILSTTIITLVPPENSIQTFRYREKKQHHRQPSRVYGCSISKWLNFFFFE